MKAHWQFQIRLTKIPTFQNDDVLRDRLGSESSVENQIAGSRIEPPLRVQDRGAVYAYEVVNFVDGKRSIGEIRDAVSAEYGPVPLDIVADYLKTCVTGQDSGAALGSLSGQFYSAFRIYRHRRGTTNHDRVHLPAKRLSIRFMVAPQSYYPNID